MCKKTFDIHLYKPEVSTSSIWCFWTIYRFMTVIICFKKFSHQKLKKSRYFSHNLWTSLTLTFISSSELEPYEISYTSFSEIDTNWVNKLLLKIIVQMDLCLHEKQACYETKMLLYMRRNVQTKHVILSRGAQSQTQRQNSKPWLWNNRNTGVSSKILFCCSSS